MSTSINLFDDIEDSTAPDKPFWTLPLDETDPGSEKKVLDWLMSEVRHITDLNTGRFEEIRENMAWYKGTQGVYRTTNRDQVNDLSSRTIKKVESNDTFDLLENRAARLIKYKPAVAILPANDEHSDKIGAKACKNLLDYIWYKERFEDEQVLEWVTDTMAQGECYLFPNWNPDIGDLHPEYVEKYQDQVDRGEEVPLMGENGEQEKDESGKPIFVDGAVRVGDVEHLITRTTDVRLQRKKRFRDCEYIFRLEELPVEEVRLKWPKKASMVKAGNVSSFLDVYDLADGARKVKKNHTLVIHMLHKKTKAMPKGRWVIFTPDAILHNTKLPYSTELLPVVRLTDDDFSDELHGRSFISRVKGLVSSRSKLTNMILRNIFLVSHPKWMVPAGSVKLEQLGNDITITQYKGPVEPRLAQVNATPAEVYNFRQMLGDEVFKKVGIGDTMRGQPPAGMKAFVALQFMSEMEQELFNRLILKLNAAVKLLAQLDLGICGDYYEPDDQRMIRVQGSNNRWMSVFFDVSNLSKSYDIRIQNSSALPQSKGARVQSIMDLNKEFPGLIPPEQVVELLDLGQSEKFVDAITVSIRAAEAENEAIMDGQNVPEPAEFEDHIRHWPIHARGIQDWSFKHQTPQEIKDALLDHMRATEYLMVEKAKTNPGFAQMLQALNGFPLVFKPEAVVPTGQPPMSPDDGSGMPPMPADPTQPPMDPAAMAAELGPNPDLAGAGQEDIAPTAPPIDQQIGVEPIAPTEGA